MLAVDNRVLKMHLPVELDPDFGNLTPDGGHGFVITVHKRNGKAIKYEFLLLIPDTSETTDDDLESLLDSVFENFLEPDECYKIRELTDEDVDKYTKDTPMLSFHPKSIKDEKIGFFWQRPPRHLTH